MRQWLDTLRYGDTRTKRILWSMLIFSGLTLLCIVRAVLAKKLAWICPAGICLAVVILVASMYDFSELREEPLDRPDKPVAPEDILVRYTQKHIRQILIRFHVKPNHRRILVDSSVKYHIQQTPGYVWIYRSQFHILLLEKTAREIVLPLTAVGPVRYQRGVVVNPKGEYLQFRKPSIVANVFSEYLPQVYEYGKGGIKRQYKNLYMIGEDIMITAASVGKIFELTGTEFQLRDKLTESGAYSEDFIEMYKAYTLFRDHVLDAAEYRQRVMQVLDTMALSNMLEQELMLNLEKMQTFQFITPEYAQYCIDKRKKQLQQTKKTKS